jgi:hypothetical protein
VNRGRASALIALFGASMPALSADYPCAAIPAIVVPCFEVRGRLSHWNGAPSARIWRMGTSRMLGIRDDALPPDLASLMTTFDTEVSGTFAVCPFTEQVAGKMQAVCIESWRVISVREGRAKPRPGQT